MRNIIRGLLLTLMNAVGWLRDFIIQMRWCVVSAQQIRRSVGLKRQTYYAKCGGFSVPLYNLTVKVQRLSDRIVSVTLQKKVSSTQKSTRDTPENVLLWQF